MKVQVTLIGKFDRVGEQVIDQRTVQLPGEVPVRWKIRVLRLFDVTIVGRVRLEEADPAV
jgi:hypothetical protein